MVYEISRFPTSIQFLAIEGFHQVLSVAAPTKITQGGDAAGTETNEPAEYAKMVCK